MVREEWVAEEGVVVALVVEEGSVLEALEVVIAHLRVLRDQVVTISIRIGLGHTPGLDHLPLCAGIAVAQSRMDLGLDHPPDAEVHEETVMTTIAVTVSDVVVPVMIAIVDVAVPVLQKGLTDDEITQLNGGLGRRGEQ